MEIDCIAATETATFISQKFDEKPNFTSPGTDTPIGSAATRPTTKRITTFASR